MPHELIFYKTPTGEQRIEVVYQDENFWMTQRALAELFAVNVPAINKHLKNIYETGELDPDSTLSKMEIVRPRRRVEATSCRFHLMTDNSASIVSKVWNKVAAASRRRFPSIPQRRDASATLCTSYNSQ